MRIDKHVAKVTWGTVLLSFILIGGFTLFPNTAWLVASVGVSVIGSIAVGHAAYKHYGDDNDEDF